ncbi:MAG TPA: autotransporter-associated beta strand repeat-containing protein, partial [Rariglobus sp.]
VGGAGANGSTTVSILKGAYGEIVSGGTGSTGGLVTYDSTYGVRRLDTATEYTTVIGNGQTQLDNVLYARASGTASQDTHLTAETTTINSLSFSVTDAGTNSGVTISGNTGTTLKLHSGTIFANQTVTTPVATDKILISVPKIDLNGGEGVVIVGATTANSGSNSNINAPLQIDSEITNDGGLGLTKGGSGHLRIGGTAQSTYTGNTVLNAGVLYLDKSVANIALPASNTLVINGGTVYQTNNQLPDTTNVIINGGGWTISGSSSNGNSSTEAFNNLTMTGGSFRNGASNGGTTNILGFANLSGGTFTAVGNGSNVTVTGAMTISNGATVSLGASSNSSGNSRLTLNGGLAITNTAKGAYTPITISASGTLANLGGRLILGGDVTFTGNGTNTNTTTIEATTNIGPRGTLELNGTRTFNIGNGAAATDLAINATVINGTATSGLVKNGEGTLALNGVNTYTGATAVNQGVLLLGAANALASSSQVSFGGGTLGTGGFNQSLGTVALSANSIIDLGSGTSALSFAASNGVVWTGSVTLSFVNFDEGSDTIQFVDAGLSAIQLGQIRINGLSATMDSNGFLAISSVPEPSAYALLAGAGLLLFTVVRRKPRTSFSA